MQANVILCDKNCETCPMFYYHGLTKLSCSEYMIVTYKDWQEANYPKTKKEFLERKNIGHFEIMI